MATAKIKLPEINLSISNKVNFPLMVCSHERSGTHFMMNGLSTCTEYTKDPYLDFDYCTLGPIVNFFWTEVINNFLNSLTNIKIKNKNDIYCAKNILKSHFSLKLLGERYKGNCKIVYIYRNPKDVFISYWKFLNNWKWFEGPKLQSPLELMRTPPQGQSQRYQLENYQNYFARWAFHVIDAKKAAEESPNIIFLNYSELLNNYTYTINSVCDYLNIKLLNAPIEPNRDEFVHGKNIQISIEEESLIEEFISKEIIKYPDLPNDIFS